ncbi:MAG: hypothetical protein ACOC7U_03885 [Spirochaetota bacterium]
MKKIIVKSKDEVVEYVRHLDQNFILISITDPGVVIEVPENQHCKGILRLQFHDLETQLIGFSYFRTSQAKTIKEFVLKHQDIELIICQCMAGISRSSGVAAVLAKHFNLDQKEFFSGEYSPNRLVYRKLSRVFGLSPTN